MRKFVVTILVILCFINCFTVAVGAQEVQISADCSGIKATDALISTEKLSVNAESALLFELNSSTMAYCYEADTAIDPAGLTKLMTVLLALEEGKPEDVVTVQQSSLDRLPDNAKRVGLQGGDSLTLRDLLFAVMITGADDAAVAVADHIGENQDTFVKKMNERATALGCTRTHFVSPHGISGEGQRSTARDLGRIVEQALKQEMFAELFGAVNYELPLDEDIFQQIYTENGFLSSAAGNYDERVNGAMAAAISASSNSIICTTQTENGRYLCIVIGAGNRYSANAHYTQASKVLNYAYKNYALQPVLGHEQPYGMFSVKNGENSVVVGPTATVYALLPTKYDKELIWFQSTTKDKNLSAPVAKDTAVGTLKICYDTTIIGQADLYARHDVYEEGTTIEPVMVDGGRSILWTILMWVLIVVVAVAVLAVAGLLILRQRNIMLHRKKKQLHRQKERENANELE